MLGRFFRILLALVIVGALAAGYLAFYRDREPAMVTLTPEPGTLARDQKIVVTIEDKLSDLKRIEIQARQAQATVALIQEERLGGMRTATVTLSPAEWQFEDGPVTLLVTVRDTSLAHFGKGNLSSVEAEYILDRHAPVVTLRSTAPAVSRGGTAVMRYAVSEPPARTGIQVGDWFFSGFRGDGGDHVCFFSFPYFMKTEEFQPRLIAVDAAGNVTNLELRCNARGRDFRDDDITVTDGFIADVRSRFAGEVPADLAPREAFLMVNQALREKADKELQALVPGTADHMLWKGPFLRLPGSATRSGFADHRNYFYNGAKIDEQWHLGVDLASVQNAEVPAANSGRVVFTGEMTILGQAVVLDHGMGMQSLYGHLSQVLVKVGDMVEKGDIIAHTGDTGLAFGDHLHFAINISGLPVIPLEWWDDHWITDNITSRLGQAP